MCVLGGLFLTAQKVKYSACLLCLICFVSYRVALRSNSSVFVCVCVCVCVFGAVVSGDLFSVVSACSYGISPPLFAFQLILCLFWLVHREVEARL